MIKNEKQYKVSKKALFNLIEQINKIKSESPQTIKQKLIIGSIEDFKEDIEKEIRDYEKLQTAKSTVLKERSIHDLPSMIIEYKIANHLTHKEFAKLLDLKEQQLQRYEAESFKTVSFQNLMNFLNRIQLDLKIKKSVIKTDRRKLHSSSSD